MGDAATAIFECRFRSSRISLKRRIGVGGEATVWQGVVVRGGRRVDAAIKFVHADHPPERVDELVIHASRAKASTVRLASDARLTAQAVGHAQLRQFHVQSELPRKLPNLVEFLDYGLMRVRVADGEWDACGFLATKLVRTMQRRNARHPARNARAAIRCAAEVCGVLRNLSGRRGAERLVTHGDLTPNNVLIDGRGHAVVIDFGAAELAGKMDDARSSAQSADDASDGRFQASVGGLPRSDETALRRELPRPAAKWLPPERSGVLRTLDPEQERQFREVWDVYGVGTLLAEWLLPENLRVELRRASLASADGQGRSPSAHLPALLARIEDSLARGAAASWRGPLRTRMTELLGEILLSEPAQRPTLSEIEQRLRMVVHAPMAHRGEAAEVIVGRARPPLVWSECHAALVEARAVVRAVVSDCPAMRDGGLVRLLDDGAEVWEQARTAACDRERGVEPARLYRYCQRASEVLRATPALMLSRSSGAYVAAVEFGAVLLAPARSARPPSVADARIGRGIRRFAPPLKRGGAHRWHQCLETLLNWQLESQGGGGLPTAPSGDGLALLLSMTLTAAGSRTPRRIVVPKVRSDRSAGRQAS